MVIRPSRRDCKERRLIDLQPERRAVILRLLDEGWKRASGCPEANAALGEVEITEHLRDSLRDVLKGRVAKWGKNTLVLLGTGS